MRIGKQARHILLAAAVQRLAGNVAQPALDDARRERLRKK